MPRKGRSKTLGGFGFSHQEGHEQGLDEHEEVLDVFSVEKMAVRRQKEQINPPAPEVYIRKELVERGQLSKGTRGMLDKPFGSLPPVFDLPQHRRVTRREGRGKSCPPSHMTLNEEGDRPVEQEGQARAESRRFMQARQLRPGWRQRG